MGGNLGKGIHGCGSLPWRVVCPLLPSSVTSVKTFCFVCFSFSNTPSCPVFKFLYLCMYAISGFNELVLFLVEFDSLQMGFYCVFFNLFSHLDGPHEDRNEGYEFCKLKINNQRSGSFSMFISPKPINIAPFP